MNARSSILLAALVAVLQIGFLGWMIAGRAAILRDGEEALLKVEPVDPRDLLRGDYVRLGYEISRLPVELIANLPQGEATSVEGPIVVRVRKDPDGYWRATSAWLGAAAATAPAGDVDLRGNVQGGWNLTSGSTIAVDYGIERFYVPEGEGYDIETARNAGEVAVVARVGKGGQSQIRELRMGGVALYDEPLY